MHCISKTYYHMFQLSATVPNLYRQLKSSLIYHLINDRLLDAWPTVSFRYRLNSSISRTEC